ncbi:sodium-independent sulfate anion transporter-like isoform X1 [Diprion similis]|uniref:sodium-independent sulfate anion transporter-like isoform X1 n=2 Tax=Diprion similis TaxID=362088 RepID=UPI001EF8B332|nr:sodium-independent sulfate anion transporter-like isoform X1 [Diprion similis]
MKMVKINFLELAKRRLPITVWLPVYTPGDALSDLVAGITVGLTLIPQAIAYAALAGLGPQFGLYSAFAGSLVYIVLGTCKEVNIGPTALISLLTFTYAKGHPELAVLLCFLSGCMTLLLGILRLGFLVELVSAPVVSGFTSAASLIIACSQIKGLLGVSAHGEGFVEIWKGLYESIHAVRIPDLILSCCCITVLLVLKRIKECKSTNQHVTKCLWFVGTARNALVVVSCAVAGYLFEIYSVVPFKLTGHIRAGLPTVGPPQFSMVSGNHTVSFLEMCQTLRTGIIVVPLVSVIGNVAIAKAFSHGKALDATQELFTLGVCNVVGSFFSSIPVTGSFSRSAVNNASGVRSPLGGLYSGVLVILALSLLTPYFYYIPKATLSSVVICAVIFMVDIGIVQPIWRCSKKDLIPALGTFLACLFVGVELGILIGVAIDVVILIYFNARPHITVEQKNQSEPAYVTIQPGGALFFPAIDHLREKLTKNLSQDENSIKSSKRHTNIVLDCKHVDRIDFTAVQGLNSVLSDLSKQGCNLVMLNPKPEILASIQSISKDPILWANSETELISILRQVESTNPLGSETRLEMNHLTNSTTKARSADIDRASTNL